MKGGKLYNDILKRMGRELYSLVSEEWSFCLPVCHCAAEFEYEVVFCALRSIVLVFVYQNYPLAWFMCLSPDYVNHSFVMFIFIYLLV